MRRCSVAGKYAVDWCTTNFKAGDAVVLAIDTFHMSATNCTDRIRVSCDTRWQPVSACLLQLSNLSAGPIQKLVPLKSVSCCRVRTDVCAPAVNCPHLHYVVSLASNPLLPSSTCMMVTPRWVCWHVYMQAKDARDPRLKAWMGPEQVVRYPAP